MNHRENRGTQRKRGGKFKGHQRHIIEISGNPPAVYVETPSTWLASLVVLALMVVAIVPICTSSWGWSMLSMIYDAVWTKLAAN